MTAQRRIAEAREAADALEAQGLLADALAVRRLARSHAQLAAKMRSEGTELRILRLMVGRTRRTAPGSTLVDAAQ